MDTNATPTFSWRKTKDGEWVVCGLAKELKQAAKTHAALPVATRKGDTQWVRICRVGKTFGDGLAYGYLPEGDGDSRRSGSSSREQDVTDWINEETGR